MENPNLTKLIRRCCVCKAIKKDGSLIPLSAYNPEELMKLGFRFSDDYISKNCVYLSFGEETAKKLIPDVLEKLVDFCPK